MLLSKYNIYVKNKADKLVIFNSLYNCVVKLTRDYYPYLLKDPFSLSGMPNDLFSFLAKNNVIVEPGDETKCLQTLESSYKKRLEETLSITLIPSFECNFRCAYCYENHENHERVPKQRLDELLTFISQKRFKHVNVDLFGGEPLLFISTIVPFLKSIRALKDVSFNGSMTTNGFLLNSNTLKLFLNHGVRTYQITLDGGKESHNKKRPYLDGSNTYDVILNNLKEISKIKGDFKIIVRCNLSSGDNFLELLDDLTSLLRYDSRFSILLFPVSDWGSNNKCLATLSRSDLFIEYTSFLKSAHIRDEYFNLYLSSSFACTYSKPNSFVLLPNGRISFCTIKTALNEEAAQCFDDVLLKTNREKSRAACKKKDCPYYPHCLGYSCHNGKKEEICHQNIEDIKTFIKEYFYE